MASLSNSLSIAVQALNAADGAIQATNNNIANVNTPGYTRQVAILQEAAPTEEGNLDFGNGVMLEGYQSVRDELVQSQIQQETSAQSGANSQQASMNQIQPAFASSTQDIGTQMSALFSSISALSTDPTNAAARQAVLTSGQNLATAFNNVSNTLTTQQSSLNTQVSDDVGQIDQLSQQIAALNPQIAQLKSTGQDGGTAEDQQDQLVLQLSALTSVAVTQSDSGETITTGTGTPLVVGGQSYALQTTPGTNGMTQVLDQNGTNVTKTLTGGDLGGTVQMRDATIPGLKGQLDTLANQLAVKFNKVQANGTDENGNAGENFFTIPSTVAGTAGSIAMNISDPALIAASSDGSTGGNGNLAAFSAIQTTALASGMTPTDAYSRPGLPGRQPCL